MEVTLSRGFQALIDDEDYNLIKVFKWHVIPQRNTFYAASRENNNGKRRLVYMHRLILRLPHFVPMIDHKDMNGLNNCKDNLRICTRNQNHQNTPKARGIYTSVFKGVSWIKHIKKWRACIAIDRKGYHIGVYRNEIDAALAYDNRAKELFGEFARLNFPKQEVNVENNTMIPLFVCGGLYD